MGSATSGRAPWEIGVALAARASRPSPGVRLAIALLVGVVVLLAWAVLSRGPGDEAASPGASGGAGREAGASGGGSTTVDARAAQAPAPSVGGTRVLGQAQLRARAARRGRGFAVVTRRDGRLRVRLQGQRLTRSGGTRTLEVRLVSRRGRVRSLGTQVADRLGNFSAAGSVPLAYAGYAYVEIRPARGRRAALVRGRLTPPSAADGRGIWLSRAELRAQPAWGEAWENVRREAAGGGGSALVSNQNSRHDTHALALALVAARSGDSSYRTRAADAIVGAIGTESGPLRSGSRMLPISRNVQSYVVAADLIRLGELDPAKDARFRAWIQALRTQAYDGDTMVGDHERKSTNHGTMAGAARAAIAAYLGDARELARVAQVFKGWTGDRASYAGFSFQPAAYTFMPDPSQPRAVNPPGAVKDGHSVDGLLPAESMRCGRFRWPPCYTFYVWGGLSGAAVQAEILQRAGYDAWQWEDQALRRAYQRLLELSRVDRVWWQEATTGDDSWQPWLANFAYGTSLPAVDRSQPGKNMGWADWTHGSPRLARRAR